MEHIKIGPEPRVIPPPQLQLRTRRELPSRDTINARNVDYWRSDVPQPIANQPQLQNRAAFFDMSPVFPRNLDAEQFRQGQLFVVDEGQLQQNPYFQKYDITNDPRNLARELKAAVVETKPARSEDESRRLYARGFDNRNVPPPEFNTTLVNALEAYDKNRPKLNDMKAIFR
jgi:hypothetical protein